MEDEAHEVHRKFAVALFNETWDLIEKPDRSADDDAAMLIGAAASRWHWGQIGGPDKTSVGDWQIAHVGSLLGFGRLAKFFAERSLSTATSEGWDGWRLASAHEGMARACAASGDPEGRAEHLAKAREALDREPDQEEVSIIEDQLRNVPDVS